MRGISNDLEWGEFAARTRVHNNAWRVAFPEDESDHQPEQYWAWVQLDAERSPASSRKQVA